MTVKILRDDCFFHDSDRLRHDEAIAILKKSIEPVVSAEDFVIENADGRTLAARIDAGSNIPSHDNSAVDGYAFAYGDYDRARGTEFPVAARVAAGRPLAGAMAARTAARIFTGAFVPDGHDTVVMQEDIDILDGDKERDGIGYRVRIPAGLKANANVRPAGEDVRAGETLFEPGHRLRPQDLASLAALGLSHASCFRPLRVAVVSTGDEIIRPGNPLKPGQLYDANAPMLRALIATTGAEAIDEGVLADDRAVVEERLRDAAGRYDVIITSGGASLGEEDHVVDALATLGQRHIWQLAIKPGRPMTFGQIGDTVVLGLPGNPVAVFVCFLLYAWPMLRRLGGADWPEPERLRLKAAFALERSKTGRREFWRAMLRQTDDGQHIEKYGRDGSGLISSLRAADGLIDIDEDLTQVNIGDEINFIPFSQFGISRNS
jgi:molybdopterin molybdotransferase